MRCSTGWTLSREADNASTRNDPYVFLSSMRKRALEAPRGSCTVLDASCQFCRPWPIPSGIVSIVPPDEFNTSSAALPWYELSGEWRSDLQAY